MKTLTRRTFLGTAASTGALLAFPSLRLGAAGTNEDIRIAVIGLGSKGKSHVKVLLKTPGARLTALCDVEIGRAHV